MCELRAVAAATKETGRVRTLLCTRSKCLPQSSNLDVAVGASLPSAPGRIW